MALKILKIANIVVSLVLLAWISLAFGSRSASEWTIGLLFMPAILIFDTLLLNTPGPDRKSTGPHNGLSIWALINLGIGFAGLWGLIAKPTSPLVLVGGAVFFLLVLLSGVALILRKAPVRHKRL
jgi:hypothetical protein